MTSFRDEMAATAQPQSCDFFDKLPLEIRQKIYGELWALHDIRQHVDFDHDDNQSVPVFPCITHSGEEDIRYEEFEAARPAGGEDMTRWEGRLKSPWNTHWKCAEAAAARASKLSGRRISSTDPIRFRTHLDTPLLVCKRMYLEAVESLEDSLTFCFNDIMVAKQFLADNASRTIRNIDISVRVKPLFTELYFPGPDGEPQPHIGGIKVTAKDNPWEELCKRLAELPTLKELTIWLDSEDLRPWHKRVNEREFFARLFQAKALQNFVLYLPELPDNPDSRGLPGCYLVEDSLENAPFVVKRAPRPNNWQLHLSRVSHSIPEAWSHSLWSQVKDKLWAG